MRCVCQGWCLLVLRSGPSLPLPLLRCVTPLRNAVASRDQRLRLTSSRLPLPPTSHSANHPSSAVSALRQHRSNKKRRSSPPHPPPYESSAMSQSSNGSCMEKVEPALESSEAAPQLALHGRSSKSKILKLEAVHEVPVMSQAFSPRGVRDCTLLLENASPSYHNAVARLVDSGADLREMDAKVIEEASVLVEELPLMDDLEVLSLCRGEDFCGEDYCIDFSSMGGSREAGGASSDADGSEEAVDGRSGDGDGFSAERVKMEEDSLEYGEAMKIEVDEMLASEWNGWREEEVKQKICLQLNYEDVLSAWSDRGPLWADDTCPQIVPYHSSYEAADALATARDHSGYLNTGLVPDFSFYSGSSTTGEQPGQVPVVNFSEESTNVEGREARVIRYREKRRNRLFSKRIRYEVRKLTAERRPRFKGRFVKKNASL